MQNADAGSSLLVCQCQKRADPLTGHLQGLHEDDDRCSLIAAFYWPLGSRIPDT